MPVSYIYTNTIICLLETTHFEFIRLFKACVVSFFCVFVFLLSFASFRCVLLVFVVNHSWIALHYFACVYRWFLNGFSPYISLSLSHSLPATLFVSLVISSIFYLYTYLIVFVSIVTVDNLGFFIKTHIKWRHFKFKRITTTKNQLHL